MKWREFIQSNGPCFRHVSNYTYGEGGGTFYKSFYYYKSVLTLLNGFDKRGLILSYIIYIISNQLVSVYYCFFYFFQSTEPLDLIFKFYFLYFSVIFGVTTLIESFFMIFELSLMPFKFLKILDLVIFRDKLINFMNYLILICCFRIFYTQ